MSNTKKKTLPRTPTVENKYNLTIKDIRKLKVADRSMIKKKPWWRNNVIDAWCISRSIGSKADREFCTDNSFWIGIYDEDAKAYAGKFRFTFSTYGGMCGYTFNTFYRPADIENENDLKTQEMFLNTINKLIDNGTLVIEK